MKINNHLDIKNYILRLEARFPVDIWKANGIDLWPHIRIKIYYQLIQFLGESSSSTTKNIIIRKSSRLSEVKGFLVGMIYYLRFYFNLSNKKLIFFGLKMHKVQKDGIWFNRFFDSMIAYHCLSNDVYSFELNEIQKPSYNEQYVFDMNLLLKTYSYVQKLKKKLFRSQNQISELTITHLKEFNGSLKQEEWYTEYLDFSEANLNLWSLKIQLWESFFKKIYKKTNPKKVIFLSYYGFDAMAAAMSAANKLNILTVDMQHGTQTNVHMAYSYWTKIPTTGFNTMPREYWNWDQYSKLNLESWWHPVNAVKKIGHPWLSFCMDGISSKATLSNNILYTLQKFDGSNLEFIFSKQLIESLKLTKENWTLRIHPRNDDTIEVLINFLESHGVNPSDYVIEYSKEVSIYESLSNCLLHITNYSGCFIEAYLLGVKSIVIDEIGYDLFTDYFEADNNYYLNKYQLDFSKQLNRYLENLEAKSLNELDDIWDPLN
ncbi:hypothetical protein [Nonlabens dokdonensis]|nr:hypothetical protein [Nonlabens dokdonensis]